MNSAKPGELAPDTPLNGMQLALAGNSTPVNADIRARLDELRGRPVAPTFDAKHLHEIHHRLYGESALTAGRARETNLRPDGSRLDARTTPAARELAIRETQAFARLTSPKELRGASKDQLVESVAKDFITLRDLNIFNQGNLPTLAVFFRQYAEAAGYSLDLLQANRARFEPAAGSSQRSQVLGVEKEMRRLAQPEYAIAFGRMVDSLRRGIQYASRAALDEHPVLMGAVVREGLARSALNRDGHSPDAMKRYDSKIQTIQRQLDAGRPPEPPAAPSHGVAQRDTRAAAM